MSAPTPTRITQNPPHHNNDDFTLNFDDPLDLFSTSQTNSKKQEITDHDLCFAVQQKYCHNNAPYFGIELSKKRFGLWQGCCNDWTCPRCGVMRAKQEYGRIVEGCRILADDHDIYFITLTCRGADLTVTDADKNYLKWTNKLITACRMQAKRADNPWHYVQVTERQKRGHPHSHVLTTFVPKDIREGKKDHWQTINGERVLHKKDCLRSDWLEKRCVSAGLGNQYDISKVETVEGASRYVAKYLFKESMFSTNWAKNWRRVRYSQSFPKREQEKNSKVFPIVHKDDWKAFAKRCVVVKVHEDSDFVFISRMLGKNDILIQMTERVEI